MQKVISSLLITALVGLSLAVPQLSSAQELPTCLAGQDPATTPCVASPDSPTTSAATTTDTAGAPPSCSTVADPKTTPCTGPTGPTGSGPTGPDATQYNWVWNGTAWEAEGYPYIWNGTKWVEKPTQSASNSNTGPESSNNATASSSNDADVDLSNNATINNSLLGNFDTGNNTVSGNTNVGNLTSGSVRLTIDLLNFINSTAALQGGTLTMADIPTDYNGNIELTNLDPQVLNAILAYYVGSIFEILARNTNTGPNSANNATSSSDNSLNVDASQNQAINNDLNITANTGGNSATYNTGVGNLTTGNIDLALNLVNIINSILSVPVLDIAMLNIFGSLFGDIYLDPALVNGNGASVLPQSSASNTSTGPYSNNDANASSSNNVNVDSANNANSANNLNINANTGGNYLGYNTTAGSLNTGDVNISMAIADIINQISGDSWFLVFVNVMGRWTGEILGINGSNGSVVVLSGPQLTASNANTGPFSENNASSTAQSSADISAANNSSIANDVNLNLNTGNNTVSYNTGAGNLTTGNINVVGNIVNIINQAINLNQRLFLGFVNIMGDWFGSLRPRPAVAVGGNSQESSPGTDQGGGESSQGQGGDTLAASVETSVSASTKSRSAGIASGVSISDETVAFAGPEVSTFTMPAGEDANQNLATWKIVSLILVTIGVLLLVGDAIIRRRRTGTFL